VTEYENEPIRGLPGHLPDGEHIVWQGAPDWRMLARTAFSTRIVAVYFALLTGWALVAALTAHRAGFVGVEMTLALGALALVLLHVLAWAAARTTVYTLTNRRVVLRFGIAVPKCVNLPLAKVASVDLARHADGTGDVPLLLDGPSRLGVLALWPHARPWAIVRPQPMLRAIPDAETVAGLIARECRAAHPDAHGVVVEMPMPRARRQAQVVQA
jgi:hypothetical protein